MRDDAQKTQIAATVDLSLVRRSASARATAASCNAICSAASAASASTMCRTASSTSSVTQIRSRSVGPILPSVCIVARIQSSRPCQYDVPISTTGKRVTFPVCTSVSASNSSSIVPKPPGSTTNACAYLTNMVLRAKK